MSFKSTKNKEVGATNSLLSNIEKISRTGFEASIMSMQQILNFIKEDAEKTDERHEKITTEIKTFSTNIVDELKKQTTVLEDLREGIVAMGAYMLETSREKPMVGNQQSDVGFKGSSTNLGQLGKDLVILSAGIAAFGIVMTLITPAHAMRMIVTATGFGIALNIFSRIIDDVNLDDVKDLHKVAFGLATFGAVMIIAGNFFIDAIYGIGVMSLALIGFGMALKLVDAEEFREVGIGLTFLSIGLVSFGLSLAAISQLDYDPMKILLLGGALLAYGGIMWVLDKIGGATILRGSIMIGLMSLSMVGFAYAFNMTGELIGGDWYDMFDTLGKFGVALLGVGTTFALAGAALPLTMAGALSIGLMGGSMVVFSYGIKQIQDLKIDDDLGSKIGGTISSIFGAFSEIGVGTFLKATFAVAPMMSLGLGISALAKGVQSFAELESKYNVDYRKIAQNVNMILNTTKDVFAEIGGESSNSSVMSFLFGTDLGKTPVERGIASVRDLGTVMTTLADGVSKWADLDKNYPDLNYDKIQSNLRLVLNMTNEVFAEIGGDASNNSLVGLVFGNDFGETPVERGIASVRDLGTVLTTLADGISKWADLDKNYPDLNFDAIRTNVKTTLGVMSEIFTEIGTEAESQSSGSLLSLIAGDDFGSTPMERGIASVRDLGTVLTTLADGVIKWNDLNNLKDSDGNPVAFNRQNVIDNIRGILTVLPEIFTEIGADGSGGWFSLSTDMEAGIELTGNMADVIATMADSVEKLSGGSSDPSQLFKDIGNTYEKISKSIKDIPLKKLQVLNDLFYNHTQLLKESDNSDDAMYAVISKLVELLTGLEQTNFNLGGIANSLGSFSPTVSNQAGTSLSPTGSSINTTPAGTQVNISNEDAGLLANAIQQMLMSLSEQGALANLLNQILLQLRGTLKVKETII